MLRKLFARLSPDLAWDGEEAAARFLSERSYRILGRRVRTRLGEVDVIAELDDLVVFVEVKTRRSNGYGQPAEAVDRRKAQHLRRVVEVLRQRKELRDRPFRIDVIEVLWPKQSSPQVTHLKSAVEIADL